MLGVIEGLGMRLYKVNIVSLLFKITQIPMSRLIMKQLERYLVLILVVLRSSATHCEDVMTS